MDFVRYMSPSPQEHAVRKFIIRRIASVVYTVWPESFLYVFGSFQSQLYLPQSDLDLVALNVSSNGKRIGDLQLLAKAITKRRLGIKVQVINARVPIVKFVDTLVGFNVDISINVDSGVNGAKLICSLISSHPSLR